MLPKTETCTLMACNTIAIIGQTAGTEQCKVRNTGLSMHSAGPRRQSLGPRVLRASLLLFEKDEEQVIIIRNHNIKTIS